MGPYDSLDTGFRIFTSIGSGKFIQSIIDTGSEGILFSRQFLGPDVVDTHEPFALKYTSSGNTYSGTWVLASVVFSSSRDPKSTSITSDGTIMTPTVARTVKMRVRAVDERNGERDPKKIVTAMIGVGFDRDTSPGQRDPGEYRIPRYINPFLQLEDMVVPSNSEDDSDDDVDDVDSEKPSSMAQSEPRLHPGFIISWENRTITLGLALQATRDFTMIPLIPQPYGWTAPLVTISLPDAGIYIEDAILLMDSGLGYTIVQAPESVDPPSESISDLANVPRNLSPTGTGVRSSSSDGGHRLSDPARAGYQPVQSGQRIRVCMPGLCRPLYSFTVGEHAAKAPAKVLWGHKLHDGLPFINTGRHALAQFDYLFDAEQGVLGIRWTGEGRPSKL
jgi:hypothetical protein